MCVYHFVVLVYNMGASFMNFVFLATRQLYFSCIVEYYILIFWQNKVMMMMMTGQLSWQRLRRSAVDLYSKAKKNRSLSHPLGHLGVTYAFHLWLVGKPSRLYIRHNWTFFAISYSWDVMSGNRSKSAFFERSMGHFERRFQREGDVADQPLLVSE